jgi:anaerobic selenocysteine-containing dehydrogenase
VAVNPLRERFAAPQSPVEMATLASTRIASDYYQVRIGGDLAVLKGLMKAVLEAHAQALRTGGQPTLDVEFIEQHTQGFEALSEDLKSTQWSDIERT